MNFIRSNDEEVTLPTYKVVCPTCDGTGTTCLGFTRDDPAVFTREDFDEDPSLYDDLESGIMKDVPRM